MLADRRVAEALDADKLDELLDPAAYLGSAPRIVDRVLARAERSPWLKDD
ncbi:hypothetical protein [Thermobacillus sp. ZCTH02-B1]|nr:hypothetical protein [Thermobacillus sp. ZCTH02-B1]